MTTWTDKDLEWGLEHLATLGLRGIPELTWQSEQNRETSLRWFAHDMSEIWNRRASRQCREVYGDLT